MNLQFAKFKHVLNHQWLQMYKYNV